VIVTLRFFQGSSSSFSRRTVTRTVLVSSLPRRLVAALLKRNQVQQLRVLVDTMSIGFSAWFPSIRRGGAPARDQPLCMQSICLLVVGPDCPGGRCRALVFVGEDSGSLDIGSQRISQKTPVKS